jgi:hypothetical protein
MAKSSTSLEQSQLSSISSESQFSSYFPSPQSIPTPKTASSEPEPVASFDHTLNSLFGIKSPAENMNLPVVSGMFDI